MKWLQELPSLIPIDFLEVLAEKSKEMAPGASKPISYCFSFSVDKEIQRKWLQELQGLFPFDFPLVLIKGI